MPLATKVFSTYAILNSPFTRANLVRFTNRAFQLKSNLEFVSNNKSEKELLKLKNDMTAAGSIINRNWLDLKVKELEDEVLGSRK